MSIVVTFLAYDWPEGVEWDAVAFPLWPGYGFRSAEEALDWIRMEMDRTEVVEVLDDRGDAWGVHGEPGVPEELARAYCA